MQIIDHLEIERQNRFVEQIRLDHKSHHPPGTNPGIRYAIRTYGCQLNENDSEKLAGQLHQMGFLPAETISDADLIILNTCSVRENADNRLFGNLGRLKQRKKENPDLIIAICGCKMKQAEHVERIKRSYPFVNLVFGPQDIHKLPEMLYTCLHHQEKLYSVGDQDTLVEGLPILRSRKFRALISIMYGCNNYCTYCIVPYTRGRERSRQPAEVLAEVRAVVADGYQEIMLLGQNVNSYGKDLENRSGQPADFAELLAAVAETGIYRIRFMTSHPKDISNRLLEAIAQYKNIEPHLHLPIQSGSNRILERMNRHYSREQFIEIVRRARTLRPGLTISTDIIVGFPGEQEDDFAQTLDLMNIVRFDSAFTFQYSQRPGTPAAEMPDQIPAAVISERFMRLLELQNRHSLESNQAMIGRRVEVLVEGASQTDTAILSGRTACNKLINFRIPDLNMLPQSYRLKNNQPNGCALEGRLAKVHLCRAKTFSIEGEMEMLLL
ncbi:MAG: tRNA (N6-isopentenyl adenosine(37)-C2)-methylthiotransferase MiaB [Clostridiaceae bacterium]|nr:tRNA (N6-isopentenyl adenosine(37)-C2)-methylthiotransferase MiaB [Clostridiaceae bacterium]